jgi:hypothetical protein
MTPLRPLPVLAALLLSLAAGCSSQRPRNVLLIVIDTLRWDHIGAYGYERDTSPAIDRECASSGPTQPRPGPCRPWPR